MTHTGGLRVQISTANWSRICRIFGRARLRAKELRSVAKPKFPYAEDAAPKRLLERYR
jgi:hypothetical protein